MERLYELILAEEMDFVGDLDKMLQLREKQAQRKTRVLYNEWESEVFERVQEEVSAKVNARSTRGVSNRNARLMDRFIEVSNAKEPYGVFRDIIIPAEYDPLTAHDEKRLTFRKYVENDPCKLELRKHEPVPGAAGHARLPEWHVGSKGRDPSGAVPRLTATLWDKLECTPYGRLGKIRPDPNAPPYMLTNNVVQDQHNVLHGYEALRNEIPRGKRCFG